MSSARASVVTASGPVYENLALKSPRGPQSPASPTSPVPSTSASSGDSAAVDNRNTYENWANFMEKVNETQNKEVAPDRMGVQRSQSIARSSTTTTNDPEENVLRRHNTTQGFARKNEFTFAQGRPDTLDIDDKPTTELEAAMQERAKRRERAEQEGLATSVEINSNQIGTERPDLLGPPVSPSPGASPGRPSTPFSEVDEGDIEDMFDRVVEVAEDSLRRQQRPEEQQQDVQPNPGAHPARNLALVRRHEQVLDDREKHDMARILAQRQRQAAVESVIESPSNRGQPARASHGLVQVVQGQPRRPAENDSVGPNSPGPSSPVRKVTAEIHNSAVVGAAITSSSQKPQTLDKPKAKRFASPGDHKSSDHHGNGQAQTPKAVVPPTVKKTESEKQFVVTVRIEDTVNNNKRKGSNSGSQTQQAVLSQGSSKRGPATKSKPSIGRSGGLTDIKAIDDVPLIIDGLTVEEVCQCLRLLNMEQHEGSFRRHQVDGNLLSGLKESVLVTDFNFTPFNASKLMRFARGWRPKLT